MLPARVVEYHHEFSHASESASPAISPRFWRAVLRWEFPILLAIVGMSVYFAMDAQLAVENLGSTSSWASRTDGYENVKRDRSLRAMESELAQYDRILPGDSRIAAIRADMHALRDHSTLKDKARLAMAIYEIREAAEERDAADAEARVAANEDVGVDPGFDVGPERETTPATTTESLDNNPTMAGI